MYSQSQDLGPYHTRDLHKHTDAAQCERALQHRDGFDHSLASFQSSVENEYEPKEEDDGCTRFYIRSEVCL